ncbi:MAG: TIGR04076 family protein [Proteobacteria bacterium]|nr:TIGR04076 family protein [Pseudomonadota bacterium]
MEPENPVNAVSEYADRVIKAENRYYQEVTIRRVRGSCPYGHREGDTFRVTAMNGDGICGSLLQGIFSPLAALHYGGNILWQKKEPVLLKTPALFKKMTGKGYPALDSYRVFVEVRDIAVACLWGHKIGDVFEVDPFNMGGACCFLYTQLYPYIHVLLSGTTPGWATEAHAMSGECPDTYDRLSYRLFLEKR